MTDQIASGAPQKDLAQRAGFLTFGLTTRVWLVLLLTFAVMPSLDLWVSGLFYIPDAGGFFLDKIPILQVLRKSLWTSFNLLVIAILIMALHRLFSARTLMVPGRIWGYCLSLILLGPLLLVNLGLKSHWGRARPADIDVFGGTAAFSPPWQIAENCASNCSFVSGEASAEATGAILIGLLLWYVVRPEKRRLVVVSLVLMVAIAASLRVIKGRHFLSDALWAIVLMGTLAQALARVFRLKRFLPQVTKQALAADLRALWLDISEGLLQLIRRALSILRTARRMLTITLGRSLRFTKGAATDNTGPSEDL